ncbi:hypothetical protein [uncultured Anaerococcus sp.]|uniref:hypothetical protein n=1 Tax=uncultured Anaerococcus sp. TaxID=293428 RepID=UPI00260E6B56|nr:hypothetical protein [uncultured Anaerococcus sp.]
MFVKAGIDVLDINYSFVALPAYGQCPSTEAYIHQGIRRVLGNDSINEWSGLLNTNPGINIGIRARDTGYGRHGKGNSMRCSGWEPSQELVM